MCRFIYEYFSLCKHQTLTLLNSCANAELCTVYASTHNFDPSARRQQRIPPAGIHNDTSTRNDRGPSHRSYTLSSTKSVPICRTGFNQGAADGHARFQISPSSLRPLSAPPESNRPPPSSVDVLESSEISSWFELAESGCVYGTLLHGSEVTLFPSDVKNDTISILPSEVKCGIASHAETEELVTADASGYVSSADHVTLGSNSFDGNTTAHLEDRDELRGHRRPQWPVPRSKTGDEARSESPVSTGSSQFVVVPPGSAILVDEGSDVTMSSRTDPSLFRNHEEGDDFPLLPKAQRPNVTDSTKHAKTRQYASESIKPPSMTWAERLKATIASASEQRSPITSKQLHVLGPISGNSDDPTAEPGQQMDSREVSYHTKLDRVPISSLRIFESVSPRRSFLPIEWQTAAPSSSPQMAPKSDIYLNISEPLMRSSESPSRAYGSSSKFQGTPNRTNISMMKGSQTVTASSGKVASPSCEGTQTIKLSTPLNAPEERLVQAIPHGIHLPSAPLRSSLTPSLLSASSPPFVPRALLIANSDSHKKLSFAEVASLRLPALPCTPNTPSSGSATFFSAPQTPEHSTEGVTGVLGGQTTELDFKIAAAAEHGSATPLKTQGRIEWRAPGLSRPFEREQSTWEHQQSLSMCNSDQQGKKRKKKRHWRRKHNGVPPPNPGRAASLQRQSHSLTPSVYTSLDSTRASSPLNLAPLMPIPFATSKLDGRKLSANIGTELPVPTGTLQDTSQVYTEIAKITPYSRIVIVSAAEHVGWYCPACYLKQRE